MKTEVETIEKYMRYPMRLTCPYPTCESNALPAMLRGDVGGNPVRAYVCVLNNHTFYVHQNQREVS